VIVDAWSEGGKGIKSTSPKKCRLQATPRDLSTTVGLFCLIVGPRRRSMVAHRIQVVLKTATCIRGTSSTIRYNIFFYLKYTALQQVLVTCLYTLTQGPPRHPLMKFHHLRDFLAVAQKRKLACSIA
jgi:hypothetical protein